MFKVASTAAPDIRMYIQTLSANAYQWDVGTATEISIISH